MSIFKKEITDNKPSFLEALLGEACGNIRVAMDVTCYSKSKKPLRL